LHPNLFNDSHFLSAARTFQDQLYSGWMTKTHEAKVEKFQAGIADGTLSAPWKDEVWERDAIKEQACSDAALDKLEQKQTAKDA
jgi:hypothetical protein